MLKFRFLLFVLALVFSKIGFSQGCSDPQGPDYVLTSNTTWDATNPPPAGIYSNGRINRNIVVGPGVTLTINGITLNFNRHGMIKVLHYGDLVLNGGLLTCPCPDIPGTGINEGLWRGIKVWGDPNLPQSDPKQGKVTNLARAEIRHAFEGILSENGGVVQLRNFLFKDCVKGITFGNYPNYTSSSELIYCEFIVSDGLKRELGYPNHGVAVWGSLGGLRVHGSQFRNYRHTRYHDHRDGTAVEALSSGIRLEDNLMVNWYRGIKITNGSNNLEPIMAMRNWFIDNQIGVEAQDKPEISLYRNKFDKYEYDFGSFPALGITASNCAQLWVHENRFEWSGFLQLDHLVGAHLVDCGNPVIQANVFEDESNSSLRHDFKAIVFDGDNSSCIWRCNKFNIEHPDFDSYDIYVDGPASIIADQGWPGSPTRNKYNAPPDNQNQYRVYAPNSINHYYATSSPRELQQSMVHGLITVHNTTAESSCIFPEIEKYEPIEEEKVQAIARSAGLYPNPTSDEVKLEIFEPATAVRVISLDGKLILQRSNLSAGTHKLDLSNLSNGLYLVEVQTQSARKVSKLMVSK